MSDLMRRVREARTTREAIGLLLAEGYEAWEARLTALAERGGGGPYDVIENGEYVVPRGLPEGVEAPRNPD